jgi:hypothetical protein
MHRYPDSIALDIAHGHSDQFTITATNGGAHGAADVHRIRCT